MLVVVYRTTSLQPPTELQKKKCSYPSATLGITRERARDRDSGDVGRESREGGRKRRGRVREWEGRIKRED